MSTLPPERLAEIRESVLRDADYAIRKHVEERPDLVPVKDRGTVRRLKRTAAKVKLADDLDVVELDAAHRDGKGLPPRDLLAEMGVVDTDMANARRFAELHRHQFRFTPERGWLAWDGKRWMPDDHGRAMSAAKATARAIFDEIRDSRFQKELFQWARRSQSRERLLAMLALAQSEDGIPARLTDFDADPMLLNVENGTIDLRTGNLRPHDPADRITRIVPIPYDPKADCDHWDAFLWRVVGKDRALYDYVQRAVGYTLTGRTDEQCLFFCYGMGANGKSVFLETVQALVADYATTARTETIMARTQNAIPNDVAALRGARFVSINETGDGQRMNEPLVKDLTGGDTVTARFMHGEYFTFRPAFKLWIRGNHKPVIRGTDHGIWRRIHLIPFAVTIPPEERDTTLPDTLRGELAGILTWAVQGCLAWQRDGLRPPECVTQAVSEYRSEMDVLGAFIEERCEVDRLAEVTAKALYAAYRTWAEDAGERPVTQTAFGMAMVERGFDKARKAGGYRYHGIRLANPETWQDRADDGPGIPY